VRQYLYTVENETGVIYDSRQGVPWCRATWHSLQPPSSSL
jgi:hypothetical protein